MPRKRMIDPEFWSDEKIGKLSPNAKLLFIGLWNFADDEGIFQAHPLLLTSQIFPYEKEVLKEIDKFTKELIKRNLVYFYARHGEKYGIILNFKKHQYISHPQPSKLPKPSIQNNRFKNAIFKRDNFTCQYCKKKLKWQTKYKDLHPTIDHTKPLSKGGSDLPDNLITACEHCNKGKGNKDIVP